MSGLVHFRHSGVAQNLAPMVECQDQCTAHAVLTLWCGSEFGGVSPLAECQVQCTAHAVLTLAWLRTCLPCLYSPCAQPCGLNSLHTLKIPVLAAIPLFGRTKIQFPPSNRCTTSIKRETQKNTEMSS